MSASIVKKSNITINVGLDELHNPVTIHWQADDAPEAKDAQEAKAMLISFFDEKQRDTLRIDLWTNEFQIMEMDRLMFHTLRGLADTYFKATKNKQMAERMQQFAQFFGEETGCISPQQQ